ncbi:MAG: hypothetical protein ABIH82_01545, partial [Candidatus Woesearchaeota archaeon]
MEDIMHEGQRYELSKKRGLYLHEDDMNFGERHPLAERIIQVLTPGVVGTGIATLAVASLGMVSYAHAQSSSEAGFDTSGEHNVTGGLYFQSNADGIEPRGLSTGLRVSYDQVHKIGTDKMPYDGAQLSLEGALDLVDGTSPFLVVSGATPRLLWDWLRITGALQTESNGYTAVAIGGDLTLAEIVPLEFRAGGILSHKTSPEGQEPIGAYFGGKLRLPYLTLDLEGDTTNEGKFNGRGFGAGFVDGVYFAAGGNSQEMGLNALVGLENMGNWGFMLEMGLEGENHPFDQVQYGRLMLASHSNFGRHQFDDMMSRAVGNNISKIVGRDIAHGYPVSPVGVPLATPMGRFGQHDNTRDLIGLPTDVFAATLGV